MNKKHISLLLALAFFLVQRVARILYTGHTFEDAFITFRFAENVAAGNGFVYNIGEHVYGTTTPLFTMLLALWVTIFPGTIIVGAWVYNLTASALMIIFLGLALKNIAPLSEQYIITILALAVSDFLVQSETDGMEMSLVLYFMSLSFYGLTAKKDVLTGIALGFLLWTRVDGVFWTALLILAQWLMTRKFPLKTILAITLIYLPWILFATFYFGSPVPQTIIAKAWDSTKLRLWGVALMALSLIGWPIPILGLVGVMKRLNKPWIYLFLSFFLLDIARLIITQPFEARYFVPAYWAGTILLSFGLYAIWNTHPKHIGVGALLIFVTLSINSALPKAYDTYRYQKYVYIMSLKNMGVWLNKNTPAESTVLLEPLGYVGYYADRHMLDEVGLVTPEMIAVRSLSFNRSVYYAISVFKPDYVIQHCERLHEDSWGFFEHYEIVFKSNPLGFDPSRPYLDIVMRNACYVIWGRN